MTSHRAKGQARRADVVRVATAVLAREGLDGFVLRDIAGRAGMTLGNLQYYFPSRDDLVEAVVREEFARNVEAVRLAARDGDLRALAGELLAQWAAPSGAVFATLFLLARQDAPGGRFAAVHRDVYRTFYEEVVVVLRRHDPAAGDEDLLTRARVVTALLDGLSLQGFGDRPDHGPPSGGDARARDAVTALITQVAAGRGDVNPSAGRRRGAAGG